MRCEKCKAETVVKDSRPKDKSIRRRRECLRCGHRFFTMEVLEAKPDLKIVLKPTSKPVKRKARKPRFEDLNFDLMTDEQIEAAMEEYK